MSNDVMFSKIMSLSSGILATFAAEEIPASRDVNVSYFLGFPIFSMLVLTHLFLNLKCY